ncbi:LOW QUALITY PROTEIN: hypothetical protein CVT26_008197 [Gymnopilus dilepis]|uniref:Nephrocystin 3-like N-terminal domain-containing protein n=1 Tax=Gymnopilus dilepis TaxID=231916 RepID=A0A409XX59_9AGAR|nr:LOW QUALITY PROTEIN: hypothetical protein CVT26_008197 [Gymnopilus dilepis]
MSHFPSSARSRSRLRDKVKAFFHRSKSKGKASNVAGGSILGPQTQVQNPANLRYGDKSLTGGMPAGSTVTASKNRVVPILGVVSQVLKAASIATASFPPAQLAVGALSAVVDTVKGSIQNDVDRRDFKKVLEETIKRLDRCMKSGEFSDELVERILRLERSPEFVMTANLKSTMATFLSNLKADLGSVDEAMDESWWSKWMEVDTQEVSKRYGKLQTTLSLFITETVIDIDGQVEALSRSTAELRALTKKNHDAIAQLQADEKFKRLNTATHVEYDAGPSDLRRCCTPETRKRVLGDLIAWATDDTNTQVYWLCGLAGTGKTTIAYSFCEMLQEAGLLCTSFFCCRGVSTSMNPRDVLPSISYHLASFSRPFAESLLDILRNPVNANIEQKELEKQFDTLILAPANAMPRSEILKRRVVVYDGCDEASNLREVSKLVGLFLKHSERLPFKILISSRRDDSIMSEFERVNVPLNSTLLFLHELEDSLVEEDIRLYIRERLSRISNLIMDSVLDKLVNCSGTLFIYAAVLCSFVDHGTKEEVQARLLAVLEGSLNPIPGTLSRPYDALDRMYAQILSGAVQSTDSTDIWDVLLVILTAQDPLTAENIADILDFAEYRVSNVTSALHAVLNVSNKADHPVTLFHTSFRDFVSEKSRGAQFYDLISAPRGRLASRCLQIIQKGLITDNICSIEDKSIKKSTVEAFKIQACISAALQYACANYIHHLMELEKEQLIADNRDVVQFFDDLILRWIECMSWLGMLENAVKYLRRVEASPASSSDLRLAVMDAKHFVLQCYEAIRDFPLEVYHSALVWLPQNSRIARRHQWQVWNVTRGISQAWNATEASHWGRVLCLCLSHDGQKVVSGSEDGTVGIWDVATGSEIRKLEGHLRGVHSVVISRDDRKVLSGAGDGIVRVWDVLLGSEEHRFEGHSDLVGSVDISDDGQWAVSGSRDKTVRVWNVGVGKLERIFRGHTKRVASVAISYDGKMVVSGSQDKTARIWHVDTGVEGWKMTHRKSVWSVAISHSGRKVASGSADRATRIWDVETGKEERRFEGLSDLVTRVAFSSDDMKVISQSKGETLLSILDSGRQEGVPKDTMVNGHPDFLEPSIVRMPITYSSGWLSGSEPSDRLWVPSQFRNFCTSVASAQTIAFGFKTGDVCIIKYFPS